MLTISRVIFLLFIVVLSVYFIFLNKNFNKEHFTDATTALDPKKVDEIVNKAYLQNFKRNPSTQELTFFQAFYIEKKPNETQLEQAVASSGDIVNKMYAEKTSNSIVLQESYGTEDDVTEVFNTILNRLPNEGELETFSKLLKQDSNFTMQKLKEILYGSEEFSRLEKTQSNQVYSNLIGGVTDRQITLIATTNYKQVVGKDTAAMDKDELSFLKKKLVEFNLDEKIFRQFLENYIKNQPFNQQVVASQKAKDFIAKEANKDDKERQNAAAIDAAKKELFAQFQQELKNTNLVTQEANSYTDQKSGVENTQIQPPNKQVLEALLNSMKASERSGGYLDSSDVLENIKTQAKCVFDKNKYNEDTSKSMAELLEQRNKSQIRDTCARNRMYLGMDEDMVLDPSLRWKLPERRPSVCIGGKNDYQPLTDQTSLIGTLLPAANNTKVGSIVDFYPPKV